METPALRYVRYTRAFIDLGAVIASAIGFTMDIDKVPDPKGDRVKVTLCGKFLGYKTW